MTAARADRPTSSAGGRGAGGPSLDPGTLDTLALIGTLLGVDLPQELPALTAASTGPVGKLRLAPDLDPGCVVGATLLLRRLRPDLPRSMVAFARTGASLACLDVASADGPPGTGPAVYEVSQDTHAPPTRLAASLDAWWHVASDDALVRTADALARLFGIPLEADALTGMLNLPQADQPAALAGLIGVRISDELAAWLAFPHPQLRELQYRFLLDPTEPPGLLWALLQLDRAACPPPRFLLPIMPTDEQSFACVRCHPEPGWPAADSDQHLQAPVRARLARLPAGRVVRWHLGWVPGRALGELLDVDVTSYLNTAAAVLASRPAGRARAAEIAEEFDASHGQAGALPRAFDLQPRRVAVQNVVLGRTAFRYDSDTDSLAVPVWLTTEAPHVGAHAGDRALAIVNLCEAFKAGTTMELRFDEHPERQVPAALRQYARTLSVPIGADDPVAVTPAEARALFLAAAQFPDDLRLRVEQTAATGEMTPERLCYLALSGTWRPVELDLLLGCTARAGLILTGGVDPLARVARAADLSWCRAAVMIGMLHARLGVVGDPPGRVADAFEDERHHVTWSVLPAAGMVQFTRTVDDQGPSAREQPDQRPDHLEPCWTLPWTDPDDEPATLSVAQPLIVMARDRVDEADLAALTGLSASGARALLVPADYEPTRAMRLPAGAYLLRCPDSRRTLDVGIERRLLAAKVGRA
jgi:hypothetical protein